MSKRSEREPSGLSKDQHEKLISLDENAWREVVKKYTLDLSRFAHWLCRRNKSLVDDIIQETFFEALKSIDTLHDRRAFKSWLISICFNVGLGIIKKFDHPRDVPLETYNPPSQEENRWWLLSDDELLSKIEKHLPALSTQQRACLHLRYREGMLLDEIAGLLNTNQAVVRTQLCKARSKLRKLLEGEKLIED